MATKIVPVTDLRRDAGDLLEELKETGGPIYITHRSRPQGVLLGYEAFEALLARLRDLEALLAGHGEQPAAEAEPATRFSGSATEFARRLIARNRSLFEELAK
ncbi:MAG TPA: type II toxin-antitoxin system Phd/YefM family antitoxin [Anaerolineae bacterium]|nr:type II toxin-antitoxin system Phd/YefM family antitoxin [Anaerolineae bacterium]HOQ98000.1 type II toxin-antitoxin system Phd/YefM family antitoxin [Anaerolineae bacterium]HPL26683.1 type II toxin-antitoxin system Phd/YefM family antitoxin [Anaerolineae bacterium]